MTRAQVRLKRFDRLVLEAVRKLQPATGFGISAELPTERFLFWRSQPSIGKIYAALDRLQEYGYVRCAQGANVDAKSGRKRLFWFVEDGA